MFSLGFGIQEVVKQRLGRTLLVALVLQTDAVPVMIVEDPGPGVQKVRDPAANGAHCLLPLFRVFNPLLLQAFVEDLRQAIFQPGAQRADL